MGKKSGSIDKGDAKAKEEMKIRRNKEERNQLYKMMSKIVKKFERKLKIWEGKKHPFHSTDPQLRKLSLDNVEEFIEDSGHRTLSINII